MGMINPRVGDALVVLSQRPIGTGSGTVVRELWLQAKAAGDRPYLLCAGYPADEWSDLFGDDHQLITCSNDDSDGDLPHPIPGMSDIMPYPSARYSRLQPSVVKNYSNAFLRRATRIIEERNPSVIHLHHLWTLTPIANEAGGRPVVVSVHGTDLMQASTAKVHAEVVREGIDAVDLFACVSDRVRDEATSMYPEIANRAVVLGNGYNPSIFNEHGAVANHPADPLVLCVGKLVPWKGFRFAVRSVARLGGGAVLAIAGEGTTAERQTLAREASELRVNVDFLGHLSQTALAAWMRRADLFLLPSESEPYGLVLLEALACGCRAVSTSAAGVLEMLPPTVAGSGRLTVVPALRFPLDADAEEQYAADLSKALMAARTAIANDIDEPLAKALASLTWPATYKRLREVYSRLSGTTRS